MHSCVVKKSNVCLMMMSTDRTESFSFAMLATSPPPPPSHPRRSAINNAIVALFPPWDEWEGHHWLHCSFCFQARVVVRTLLKVFSPVCWSGHDEPGYSTRNTVKRCGQIRELGNLRPMSLSQRRGARKLLIKVTWWVDKVHCILSCELKTHAVQWQNNIIKINKNQMLEVWNKNAGNTQQVRKHQWKEKHAILQ